ncbi:MAG: hypothetical protein ACYC6L_01755 [Anaerolineae bacterium]
MKRISLVITALWLAWACTGCDILFNKSQKELVTGFFTTWYIQSYAELNLARVLDVTPDKQAVQFDRAVSGVTQVINTLIESDKLMGEGWLNLDPAKMDEAIQKRPGDFTYRSGRAALALMDGDLATYNRQRAEAEALATKSNASYRYYASTAAYDLESAETIIKKDGYKSRQQCVTLYSDLIIQYGSLLTDTQDDAKYVPLIAAAKTNLQACPAK